MNQKLISYFKELNDHEKIGHAFLISNIDINNLKNTLESIFSDYFFHNTLKIEENPDVFLIEPEKNVIKKEQLLNLHKFLNNTSQISGKKIYIINNCELMNPSAANSLLKMLEEPMENIYAFLLSANINNVLETIKSRCQNIFISSSNSNSSDDIEEDKVRREKAEKFISIIEEKELDSFPDVTNLFGKKVDKEEFKYTLGKIEGIYKDILNYKIRGKIELYNEKEFIEKYSNIIEERNLINKLIVINNTMQSLKYNLNISLVIDKLLIDLGRC